MKNIYKYFGNGPYCFANSTAMLLASAGEEISPSLIEVLSGVGTGACILKESNLLFLSWALPDNGVNKALDILGFTYKETGVPKTKKVPLEEFKKDLTLSPIVVGPLDMGVLDYNPDHSLLAGVDHFVFVYGFNDRGLFLHDPGGFPSVFLRFEKFLIAWKAKNVSYGKDFYKYWASPKRILNPSEEEVFEQAMNYFKSLYLDAEEKSKKGTFTVGEKAIITTANRIREKSATKAEVEQLKYFVFPLGAKRAIDYALFFKPFNKLLSDLKWEQAKIIGNCQSLLVANDFSECYEKMIDLGKLEEVFKESVLSF